MLAKAEELARALHKDQRERSTGDPYIHHVERVVGYVEGERAKTVAWLHDVVEDTPITLAELSKTFPPDVCLAVALLTRIPHVPYEDCIQHIVSSGNLLATVVKLADLYDHLRPNCPAHLRQRYHEAFHVLLGTVAGTAEVEGPAWRQYIRIVQWGCLEPVVHRLVKETGALAQSCRGAGLLYNNPDEPMGDSEKRAVRVVQSRLTILAEEIHRADMEPIPER